MNQGSLNPQKSGDTDQQPDPATVIRQERLEARDEVDEVAPGVLRIQIPIMLPGLGHVNCYVLEDDRGATIIDPGLPDPVSAGVLSDRLGSIGLPLSRIHTVFVTHSHRTTSVVPVDSRWSTTARSWPTTTSPPPSTPSRSMPS
ncbi:MAG: MBL fold metallo-hydrolase [Microthrixaceae bacterium]